MKCTSTPLDLLSGHEKRPTKVNSNTPTKDNPTPDPIWDKVMGNIIYYYMQLASAAPLDKNMDFMHAGNG